MVEKDTKGVDDKFSSVKENFIAKTSGKISEFFNHMVSYGGFTFEEGIMKIWGDPSLFIPIEAFVDLFYLIEQKIGKKDAHDIYYWLGRVYGKNSTLMLINRFGLDKKNLPDFLNGATQDGMGYLKISDYDDKNFNYGTVLSTNSTFAIEYSKKYGKTNEVIDFYLAGILSGGIEPLVDKFSIVSEKECMAKGDSRCVYDFNPIASPISFDFFNKSKLNEDDLLKKTKSMMLKRKSQFKILGKKEIKFGDGKFILRDVIGVNVPVYGFVLLNKILENLISSKELSEIYNLISVKYIDSIEPKIKGKNLKESLNELNIFGLGSFKISLESKSKIMISNINNPYSKDYSNLFGLQKIPVDIFSCILLKEFFKRRGINTNIKEVNCMVKAEKSCTFEVNFQ